MRTHILEASASGNMIALETHVIRGQNPRTKWVSIGCSSPYLANEK